MIGDIDNQNDLAWWIHKEPLRTKPIGIGTGKTAQELGITTVAHETNSFAAWESIVKSHENVPNVFISRSNGNGESAKEGDGFYTKIGTKGARHTGITIRFKVHPMARLGSDFEFDDPYVIVNNKAALEVIHEEFSWTPFEYIEKLINGLTFDHSDRAVNYKLQQKIVKNVTQLTEGELMQLHQRLLQYLENPDPLSSKFVYHGWLSLNLPPQYMPTIEQLENAGQETYRYLAENTLALPQAQNMQALIELVIKNADKETLKSLAYHTFTQPHTQNMEGQLILIIEKADPMLLDGLGSQVFTQPHTQEMKTALRLLIARADDYSLPSLARYTFPRPHTKNREAELLLLIEKADQRTLSDLAEKTFSQPHTQNMHKALKRLIERADKSVLADLAQHTFSKPHTQNMHVLLKMLIERTGPRELQHLVKYTFSQPHTKKMEELLIMLIKKAGNETIVSIELANHVFQSKHSYNMQRAFNLTIELIGEYALHNFATVIFTGHHGRNEKALIIAIEKAKPKTLQSLAWVFRRKFSQNMHTALNLLIERADMETLGVLARYVFSEPHTQNMQAQLRLLMNKANPEIYTILNEYVFSKPHTQEMHELKAIMDGLKDLAENRWNEHVKLELAKLPPLKAGAPKCLQKNLRDGIAGL